MSSSDDLAFDPGKLESFFMLKQMAGSLSVATWLSLGFTSLTGQVDRQAPQVVRGLEVGTWRGFEGRGEAQLLAFRLWAAPKKVFCC